MNYNYTIRNLTTLKDVKSLECIISSLVTEIEESTLLLHMQCQSLYRTGEANIQPCIYLCQHSLDYWGEYIPAKQFMPKLSVIEDRNPIEEIKAYAREEDIEFLKEISDKIECFTPVLLEVIGEIEKRWPNVKVEISVLRDEIGDRVYIIIEGLQFKDLEEKYKLEDEAEEIVWKIIENKKDYCNSQELEEVNTLISILVP